MVIEFFRSEIYVICWPWSVRIGKTENCALGLEYGPLSACNFCAEF